MKTLLTFLIGILVLSGKAQDSTFHSFGIEFGTTLEMWPDSTNKYLKNLALNYFNDNQELLISQELQEDGITIGYLFYISPFDTKDAARELLAKLRLDGYYKSRLIKIDKNGIPTRLNVKNN